MKKDRVGETGGLAGSGPPPDRRAFLRAGAGCALPLLAGSVLATRGVTTRATGIPPARPIPQDAVDPVLAHIEQELVRVYHAMRGPSGVRGEHVRAIATNLELTATCLESHPAAARAEAAIRRQVAANGRDGAVRAGLMAHDQLVADLGLQFGIAPTPAPDAARLAEAIDRIVAGGLRLGLRGHRARLNRLAAMIDRDEASRAAKASPLNVRQKPGDDFLGFPEQPSAFDRLSPCEALKWLSAYFEILAVILGMAGLELPAGILGIIGILIGLLADTPCSNEATA